MSTPLSVVGGCADHTRGGEYPGTLRSIQPNALAITHPLRQISEAIFAKTCLKRGTHDRNSGFGNLAETFP